MFYEFLLLLCMMEPVADDDKSQKRVAQNEIKRKVDWPIGCWDCRSWGAIRLLDDHYAIDLDPDGNLQDWGVWQYNLHENRVLIVWMESTRIEVIEKEGDKFYRQSAYNFGPSSKIEETKKIGK